MHWSPHSFIIICGFNFYMLPPADPRCMHACPENTVCTIESGGPVCFCGGEFDLLEDGTCFGRFIELYNKRRIIM